MLGNTSCKFSLCKFLLPHHPGEVNELWVTGLETTTGTIHSNSRWFCSEIIGTLKLLGNISCQVPAVAYRNRMSLDMALYI